MVLSHGHSDHTWGLEDLIKLYLRHPDRQRPTVIAHPGVFAKRVTGRGGEMGTLVDAQTLAGRFALKLTDEPLWLTERLVWLGQIKRRFGFEDTEKPGFLLTSSGREIDPILDDSALAYRTDHGLVIITGCSHSGICNIIEQAREVSGEERVIDIVGGTHLIDPPEERMQATIDYFRRLQPLGLHIGHCTSLQAKIRLAAVAPVEEMRVGLSLEY
ncbi:MAG: MBL fold metallo-hydrolase [Bacillota bacterium]